MNVLQRAASIRGVRDLSAEETRRLEAEWNVVFTRLGVVQGQLKPNGKELLGWAALIFDFTHGCSAEKRPSLAKLFSGTLVASGPSVSTVYARCGKIFSSIDPLNAMVDRRISIIP